MLDYFEASSDGAVCFIIDGIVEADPEEQGLFSNLLEKTYSEDCMERKPPVRIVLLGRDSVPSILDGHSLGWIHDVEITNSQNKDDLYGYVSQKLQKSKLFRNASDFQEEVVQDICTQAAGLWEWANLVIKNVLRCRTKEQIRKIVKAMPKGISAMLSEELQRLARELSASDTMSEDEEGSQIQQLNIILSFVAKAQKSLTVEQLELILEIILGEEVLDLEDDLRTVYSSLFSLRAPEDWEDRYEESKSVTLRHGSFYEFFESSSVDGGPVHVDRDEAHVNVLFVLLYVLAKQQRPEFLQVPRACEKIREEVPPAALCACGPNKGSRRSTRRDLDPMDGICHQCVEILRTGSLTNYTTNFCQATTSIHLPESRILGSIGGTATIGILPTTWQRWPLTGLFLTQEEHLKKRQAIMRVPLQFYSPPRQGPAHVFGWLQMISKMRMDTQQRSPLLFAYTEITATATETADKLIDINRSRQLALGPLALVG